MTSSEQPIMQHQSPPQCQPKPRWDPNPRLQHQPIPRLDSNPQLQRQAKPPPQCQPKPRLDPNPRLQCQAKPRWNSNPRLQRQPIPRWDSNPRLLPQKEVVAIERPVIHNGIIIAGNTIRARPKKPPISEAARVKSVPGPVPILTSPSPALTSLFHFPFP